MEKTKEKIAQYWNERIHDLEVAKHPVGTKEFFDDLDEYRFDKLHYLPRVVDFNGYRNKTILEVGCGCGIDLARFSKGGALVRGIDLSQTAIDMGRDNFKFNDLTGEFIVMDGEKLEFPDDSFDVVYGHGVLQYTANPDQMAKEMYRVLKPGGKAIFMMYNRISWLNFLSKLMKVKLEHEDAPVLRKVSAAEFRKILSPFKDTKIIFERFPVKSRLHGGLKGFLYNSLFVGTFNLIPRPLVRWLGWHMMGFGTK